jgi:hypothetical protein
MLLFHHNNGCTNAPQCYVIRTLPVLFVSYSHRPYSYIQNTNQQKNSIKYNKIQIIKHNSWQVSSSYMFRHRSTIFYVLLTVHPCIISQINPTRCAVLFNIFIYFSSVHFSGIRVPIIRRKSLYPRDTGICHFVWVASGLLVGLNPTSRPDATHTKW